MTYLVELVAFALVIGWALTVIVWAVLIVEFVKTIFRKF